MRKYIYAVCFILILPALSLAEEAKLLNFAGTVEVKADRDVEWGPAEKGMEIQEGGAVRTGADGAAVVQMPNKSKVWMKESSGLEIEQRKTLASRLSLLFGRMKVRVPHLMRRERFEVRTPAAVCAVRGTEFTVDTTPEGAMDIKVLYGEVKLNFTVPPVKGKAEIHIPQGQGLELKEKGKPAKQALLTKEQERKALENWNPGLSPNERLAGIIEKENSRAQIKQFAKTTANAEQQVKSFINTAKESDLEAGRTLNDIHGNLVRVEQRLIRPDPQTLQFFNIVKRPNYVDYPSNHSTEMSYNYGFGYFGGAATNRLDMMQVNLEFDRALPQRIEEWPSFFGDNAIKPSYMTMVTANRTDPTSIFFIAQGWEYEAARDELINNGNVVGVGPGSDEDIVISGVLTGASAIAGLNKISKLEIIDAGSGDGTLEYTDVRNGPTNTVPVGANVLWAEFSPGPTSSYDKSADDVGSDQMWQFTADKYEIGGTSGQYLWFAQEAYVIGNGGNIRNTTDFTNSGSDPFTLLKENAAQVFMYIKQDNAGGNAAVPGNMISHTDYFTAVSDANIDLVFIPDLAVAAIQRMLPAITELND